MTIEGTTAAGAGTGTTQAMRQLNSWNTDRAASVAKRQELTEQVFLILTGLGRVIDSDRYTTNYATSAAVAAVLLERFRAVKTATVQDVADIIWHAATGSGAEEQVDLSDEPMYADAAREILALHTFVPVPVTAHT